MASAIVARLRTFCKAGVLLRRGLSHSPLVGRWCDDVKNHTKSKRTLCTKEPADGPQVSQGVQDHFADLPDPYQFHPDDHSLTPILFITFYYVVRTPFQVPFHLVFCLLDVESLGHCFVLRTRALAELTRGEVVAVDGKGVWYAFDPA